VKWSNQRRREALRLARQGYSNQEISAALAVAAQTFSSWSRKYPAFKRDLAIARLPIKAAKKLLKAQHISVNSERGKRLLRRAWQIHTEELLSPAPEAEQKRSLQLSTEELAEVEAMAAEIFGNEELWKSMRESK